MPDRYFLQSLLDVIPVPVFYKDTEGIYLGCNDAFCRMLGKSKEDIAGKSVIDIAPPELAVVYRQADTELLNNQDNQSYETCVRFADGEERDVVFYKAVFRHQDGSVGGIVGTLLDISERKSSERRYAHQASHDELTGLANRRQMLQRLQRTHADAMSGGRDYSILLFDLDRFKLLNDIYGHQIGDDVLRAASELLAEDLGDDACLGRWGGEEFLCLLPDTAGARALELAEQRRRRLAETPMDVQEHKLNLTTSVGVASCPADAVSLDALLVGVDAALYEAKRLGRDRVFAAADRQDGIFSLAGELEQALADGRLHPAYQVIVELDSGRAVAEEALARIVRPNGEVVPAQRFIEAACHLQLAHRIDHRIVVAAIERCMAQTLCGKAIRHFVNFSADVLRHPELTGDIMRSASSACNACGDAVAEEKPLVIEITEREFLGNIRQAREILAPMLDFGLRIAIDDFGSGYSTFQYLADLPVSFLKIEGSLIRRIKTERKVRVIVKGIKGVASDLGLVTIAEHIEDEATADILREIGIDWGQGYLYGRPELVAR